VKTENKQKREIIERLLIVPPKQKRIFWAREMKFLNDFIEKYPDFEFWNKVSFRNKMESLLLLKGEYGENLLKKKYLEYKYVIPKNETYNIGKKSGKDIKIKNNPKTIKDFLKNE